MNNEKRRPLSDTKPVYENFNNDFELSSKPNTNRVQWVYPVPRKLADIHKEAEESEFFNDIPRYPALGEPITPHILSKAQHSRLKKLHRHNMKNQHPLPRTLKTHVVDRSMVKPYAMSL